jgi:hypothetical protein
VGGAGIDPARAKAGRAPELKDDRPCLTYDAPRPILAQHRQRDHQPPEAFKLAFPQRTADAVALDTGAEPKVLSATRQPLLIGRRLPGVVLSFSSTAAK